MDVEIEIGISIFQVSIYRQLMSVELYFYVVSVYKNCNICEPWLLYKQRQNINAWYVKKQKHFSCSLCDK